MASWPDMEINRFLDRCIQCGQCADQCPILVYTDIAALSGKDIQQGVYDCVQNGTFNHPAVTKAFACMECFKCTTEICPRGLDPMLINEAIKGRYISRGRMAVSFNDSRRPDSPQRVIASVLTDAAGYERITAPAPQEGAKYLFYPGCNVYFQPEKLLNALDILDAAGISYSFVPGLDTCCGTNHCFFGFMAEGGQIGAALVKTLARYRPETVILWCPTCHCRFDRYLSRTMDLPFSVVSFSGFLAQNMKKLPLQNAPGPRRTVTLHEPCKSAYTGVDPDSTRQVLARLPGVDLIEMAHHGPDTMCCGSGAASWFPDSCDKIRDHRLKEAEQTGADQLITVCHYCSQTFLSSRAVYPFEIDNYVNLVAGAVGIHRSDKYRQYARWHDLDRIVADIGPGRLASASARFGEQTVLTALQSVFVQ